MPWEVRWFNKTMTDYPLAIDWFKAIDDLYIKENQREDLYIFLRNCEDTGIKLRGFDNENTSGLPFRFEIKWIKNRKPNFGLGVSHLRGTLEDWSKWTLFLTEK